MPLQQVSELAVTGTSFSPDGQVLDPSGSALRSDSPLLSQLAACAALCNDSVLTYRPESGTYQRIGEATEAALRVFAEKVGLPGNVHANLDRHILLPVETAHNMDHTFLHVPGIIRNTWTCRTLATIRQYEATLCSS